MSWVRHHDKYDDGMLSIRRRVMRSRAKWAGAARAGGVGDERAVLRRRRQAKDRRSSLNCARSRTGFVAKMPVVRGCMAWGCDRRQCLRCCCCVCAGRDGRAVRCGPGVHRPFGAAELCDRSQSAALIRSQSRKAGVRWIEPINLLRKRRIFRPISEACARGRIAGSLHQNFDGPVGAVERGVGRCI